MLKVHKLFFSAYKKLRRIFSKRGLNKYYLLKAIDYFLLYLTKPTCAFINGHKIFIDKEDKEIAHWLLLHNTYEDFEIALFKNEVVKGMNVLDIGANIGYYTLAAAKLVGEGGRVFAFEPEPKNFSLLEKNIETNGYKNVILVKKAVSDKSGEINLFLCKTNKGGHTICNCSDSRKSIVVNTITLDEYFKKISIPIGLIKMDIEGAEIAAFQGMYNLIKRNNKMSIFTEFIPEFIRKFGYSPEEYLKELVKFGFRIYEICDKEKKVKLVNTDDIEGFCANRKCVNLLCKKGLIA